MQGRAGQGAGQGRVEYSYPANFGLEGFFGNIFFSLCRTFNSNEKLWILLSIDI